MLTLLTLAALGFAQPTASPPRLPTAAELRANARPPTPPLPGDRRIAAEINRLEQRWGGAFVSRDFAFLESILAPAFRLVVGQPGGQIAIASRLDWMRDVRTIDHLAHSQEVVDVTTSGDTAVALVKTSWTRRTTADRPPTVVTALVTDTWVRRGGRWQVIVRHSHRIPDAPWKATLPPASN